MDFSLHPNVYTTNKALPGLRQMLEDTWIRNHCPGDGKIFIISGFGNFNGGARFYKTFKEHTEAGGKIVAVFAGSTTQRLTSKELVTALLECGAQVNIVNRKRLLHAKCYGKLTKDTQSLLVSSGNFTGPGMSTNGEATVRIQEPEISTLGFKWDDCISSILTQRWLIYQPTLSDMSTPAWDLLYEERGTVLIGEEEDQINTTLVVLLGHSDTARIQAAPRSRAGRGTQYFWLSKDSFDFFPALTIRNHRGYKGTLSTIVTMRYPQLNVIDQECRVTFEAENNFDFRLGTAPLRYTNLASDGDLACISRVGNSEYILRIVQKGTKEFDQLQAYATTFIGGRGKRYGYLDNVIFDRIIT